MATSRMKELRQQMSESEEMRHAIHEDGTITHTDQLLRKHQLVLEQLPSDETRLIDSETRKPAGRYRIQKYLTEWNLNPGFPGDEVIGELQSKVALGA